MERGGGDEGSEEWGRTHSPFFVHFIYEFEIHLLNREKREKRRGREGTTDKMNSIHGFGRRLQLIGIDLLISPLITTI